MVEEKKHLVIKKSELKKVAAAGNGSIRISADAVEMLNRAVCQIIQAGVGFASEDRRKTLTAIDVERAVKFVGKQ